ncbi:MAG: HEAT repeat domain-containing protein [Candidatus Thorarchaeota archaeon]
MSPDEDGTMDPALRRIMQIPDDQELPDDALCDVMLRALESQQLLIRSSAIHQLIALGKSNPQMAIPKILNALDPSIDFWTVRFGAVEALGEIANPSSVRQLIKYLRSDQDPDFRAMVAKQLGVMGAAASEAGSDLINALQDQETSEIRENAARTIGILQVKQAVDPLISALNNEKDEYAKRAMVWSLGELKNSQATPILISRLRDPDKETRANAAEALGKIQDGDSVLPLLSASKDSDVDVQSKVIASLVKLPVNLIVSEVAKAAKDDKPLLIQYLQDYLFNVDNELIAKRVMEIKAPILANCKEELAKIKTNLLACKVFIEEAFQQLQSISKKKLADIVQRQIPSVESQIAGISLYEFRKHKWLADDLFFDLEDVNVLYREAGIMASELRDNATALLQKKKVKLKQMPPDSQKS